MTWVYLLPDDEDPNIVVFDATMSETHDSTAEITSHPIDDGSTISDHVIIHPFAFSCDVYVTNTPIEDLGRGVVETVELVIPKPNPFPSNPFNAAEILANKALDALFGGPLKVQTLLFGEPFDRIKEVHDTLKLLIGRGASMSVVTSTATYDKVVLTSVSLPRTEYGGASFSLTFGQITTVQSATVTAPKPAEPRGASAKNKGGQGTKPLSGKDAGKSTSLALKALEALGVSLDSKGGVSLE